MPDSDLSPKGPLWQCAGKRRADNPVFPLPAVRAVTASFSFSGSSKSAGNDARMIS